MQSGALWASALIQTGVGVAIISSEDWLAAIGQTASLSLLAYVAWRVRKLARRQWRDEDTDSTGGS